MILTRDKKIRTSYEYYPNEKVKSKISYIKIKGEQMQHGITTYFYPDGKTKAEFNYKWGVLDSIQNYYNEDGKLTSKELYSNGSKIETFTY